MKNATAGDGKIDRVLEIKFWDKTKALDMYHRLNGSYQDTEDGTAALREKMANLIGQARKRWQRFEEAEAERQPQGIRSVPSNAMAISVSWSSCSATPVGMPVGSVL